MKNSFKAKYYDYIGQFIGEEEVPYTEIEIDPYSKTSFVFYSPHYNNLPVMTTIILTHNDNEFMLAITRKAGDNRYSVKEYLSAHLDTEFFNRQTFLPVDALTGQGKLGGSFEFKTLNDLFTEDENNRLKLLPIRTPNYKTDTRGTIIESEINFPLRRSDRFGFATIPNFNFEFEPLISGYEELVLTSGTGQQTRYAFKDRIYIDDKPYYKTVQTETYSPIFNLFEVFTETLKKHKLTYILKYNTDDNFLNVTCRIKRRINHGDINLNDSKFFNVSTPDISNLYSFEFDYFQNSDIVDACQVTFEIDGEEETYFDESIKDKLDQGEGAKFIYEKGGTGDFFLLGAPSFEDYIKGAVPSPITYPNDCIATPIRAKIIEKKYNSAKQTFEKQNPIQEKDQTFNFSLSNKDTEINISNFTIGDTATITYNGLGGTLAVLTAIIYSEYETKFIFGIERIDVLNIINKGRA